VEFRVDKAGSFIAPFGKIQLTPRSSRKNAHAVIDAVGESQGRLPRSKYVRNYIDLDHGSGHHH